MNDDVKPVKKLRKEVHFKKIDRLDSIRASELDRSETSNDPFVDEAESFLTPEQMAALDEAEINSPIGDEVPIRKKKPKKFNLRWPRGKKEWALTILVIIMLALGGFFVWQKYIKKQPIKLPGHSTKSNKVPSKLSGLLVDPKVNQRPVVGIMIENSPEARPQSGLYDSSIVFEAIAEGGITRFLALYQDTQPEDVGPIRSARPYYAQWLLGFDASYAHVGGSPEALKSIKNWQVRDLDQFANGNSYKRMNTRPAPHNVYTSIEALNQLASSKGYGSSDFTSLQRKSANPIKNPTAKSIDFSVSGAAYNPHYDYDSKTNSYKRSQAGSVHLDANGKQVNPEVVIALIMPYSLESDRIHSSYETLGNGQAYIFQDGKVFVGTWSKEDNQSQFTFKDDNDKPIKLNAGKTWITALGNIDQVKYAP